MTHWKKRFRALAFVVPATWNVCGIAADLSTGSDANGPIALPGGESGMARSSPHSGKPSPPPLLLQRMLQDLIAHRKNTLLEAGNVADSVLALESAKMKRGPSLFLSGSGTTTQNDDPDRFPLKPVSDGDLAVNMSYPLFNKSLSEDIGLADSRIALDSTQLDSALEVEAMQLVKTFVDLAGNNEQLQILARSHEELSHNLQLLRVATQAGLVARGLPVEIEIAMARLQRVTKSTTAARDMLVTELKKANLRDIEIYREIRFDSIAPSFSIDPLTQHCNAPSTAVSLAEKRLELSKLTLDRLYADRLPTMDIGLGVHRLLPNYLDDEPPRYRNRNSADLSLRMSWNFGYALMGKQVEMAGVAKVLQASDALIEEKRRAQISCSITRKNIENFDLDLARISEQQRLATSLIASRRNRYRVDGLRAVSVQELVDAEMAQYDANTSYVQAIQGRELARWESAFSQRMIGVRNGSLFLE